MAAAAYIGSQYSGVPTAAGKPIIAPRRPSGKMLGRAAAGYLGGGLQFIPFTGPLVV
jgi:hypothetical protein